MNHLVVRAVIASLLTVHTGCGDDDAIVTDSGVPDAADTGTDAAEALVVDLRPCPEGWREVSEEGAILCEPWPESGRADCPDGEAHFPGEPGCAPLGTACPLDAFPDDVPTGAIYVDASAAAGGDGSRGTPFESVAEGLLAASSGDVVQLARGSFTIDEVSVTAGVTLRGACAAETLVEIPNEADRMILDGPGATLENLTLFRQNEGMLIAGGAGMDATGEEIVIRGVDLIAPPSPVAGLFVVPPMILIGDSAARVERVRVRGGGDALNVSSFDAFDIEVDQLSVEGSITAASVTGGSALHMRRSSIRATRFGSIWGIYCFAIDVSSTVMEDVALGGIIMAALESRLSDVVIRDAHPVDDTDGFGIVTGLEGAPEGLRAVTALERVRIERVNDVGIAAFEQVDVTARGLLLADVTRQDECEGDECPPSGSAIVSEANASVSLDDFAVRRAALCGLHVAEGGSIDATSGEVSGCTIGVCASAEFDVSRLMDGVRYVENGINLDSSSLAVPEFTRPLTP